MNKKHILCFGDSNTWGYDAATGGRFDDDTRWTMQLSKRLGEKYYVIEEGLSGRGAVDAHRAHQLPESAKSSATSRA